MEEKSSNQKKLDDLPPSENEFWDGEVNTNLVPHDWMEDHKHYFERVTGHQGYCQGCGWGFQLDQGDRIEEGHLFDKNGKFII